MNTSFYNGISGVKTQQFGIDVWANNIANIGATGFIEKTPEFSTMFSTALTDSYFDSTSNDLGQGSKADAATLNTSTQGVFQTTDRAFDLALGGKGWFGVQSLVGETLYTRNGAFGVDKNGDMVDESGNYLLGTLGNNITQTAIPQNTLEDIGKYYTKDTQELGTPYQIIDTGDIPLGSVTNQSKINLPDILYYPPVATSEVSYQANLDPEVTIASTDILLDSGDVISTIDTLNKTISIDGAIINTPEVLSALENDSVLVTMIDINGKKVHTSAKLDASLEWIVTNKDISTLDTTNPIIVEAQLQTVQEIPNVEHFTSTIISPEGKNDILDMTYTKRVPQPASGSVWDGIIQVHSFYETYNPSSTYDPALYKVDTNAKKVYTIVDSQNALLEFEGSGKLLNSSMPTMSNSGTALNIDVGEPNSFTGFVSSVNLSKSRSEQHNGELPGLLKAYNMDGNGNIVAELDNGKSIPVAKIAVYHFHNSQGLSNVTGTLFSASANSGDPLFYTDANGNNFLGAKINSHKLEGSNVFYDTALTELLITQKALDASAKSITTSDEMIKNAINMKR